jgi:hypothetical protein
LNASGSCAALSGLVPNCLYFPRVTLRFTLGFAASRLRRWESALPVAHAPGYAVPRFQRSTGNRYRN